MHRKTMNALILCFKIVCFLTAIYTTIEIPCGEPGIPNYGHIEFSTPQSISSNNHFSSGNKVKYYCNSDTILFGTQERQCFPTGRWDNKVPQCVKSLNVKSYINYAHLNSYSNAQNSLLAVDGDVKTCFRSLSSKQEINHWWEISFTHKIQFKEIHITVFRENVSITFPDYTLWIKSEKKSFEIPKTANISIVNSRTHNISYKHVCSGIIEGDSLYIDSAKSLQFIVCEIEIFSLSANQLKCGTPDRPSNGWIEMKKNESIAYFQCNENYLLNGLEEIKCESTGLWSALSPICQKSRKDKTKKPNNTIRKTTLSIRSTTNHFEIKPILCPQLKVENGNFSFTNGLFIGSHASLQCYKGFRLLTKYQSSQCISNGSHSYWSDFENYSLICHQIECQFFNEIINEKFNLKLINGKAIYGSKMEIICHNSVREFRFCGENGVWLKHNDMENNINNNVNDLHNLCNNNSKSITIKNEFKSLDMKSLIIVSVIATITTTVIIFVSLSSILFLKRKFSNSNTNENIEAVMPSMKDFSYIEIKHNIANRRRLSEMSNIYNTIYENDEEVETCFSSSVAFGSRCKTSIIHTYSEPFDIEINGSHVITEANNENIYSEPYVSVENDIYSQQ